MALNQPIFYLKTTEKLTEKHLSDYYELIMAPSGYRGQPMIDEIEEKMFETITLSDFYLKSTKN
jgi:hypothetical protein